MLFQFTIASVKPNFQLTGKIRQASKSVNIKTLMRFPEDVNSYEVIGTMSDCSSTSEYNEFISVYKAEAAKYGANGIVIIKSAGVNSSAFDDGLCVEATAIYLRPVRPQSSSSQQGCVNELKRIIQLQNVIDSLKTELYQCKQK